MQTEKQVLQSESPDELWQVLQEYSVKLTCSFSYTTEQTVPGTTIKKKKKKGSSYQICLFSLLPFTARLFYVERFNLPDDDIPFFILSSYYSTVFLHLVLSSTSFCTCHLLLEYYLLLRADFQSSQLSFFFLSTQITLSAVCAQV